MVGYIGWPGRRVARLLRIDRVKVGRPGRGLPLDAWANSTRRPGSDINSSPTRPRLTRSDPRSRVLDVVASSASASPGRSPSGSLYLRRDPDRPRCGSNTVAAVIAMALDLGGVQDLTSEPLSQDEAATMPPTRPIGASHEVYKVGPVLPDDRERVSGPIHRREARSVAAVVNAPPRTPDSRGSRDTARTSVCRVTRPGQGSNFGRPLGRERRDRGRQSDR